MRVISGLMRIHCHCKPQGFRQGCVQGFMIHKKISNGFLPTHTGSEEGDMSTGGRIIITHHRLEYISNF